MRKIVIPSSYNYIGAFLTLSCNLNCNYCINKYDEIDKARFMEGDKWITFLNRIETRTDLPITLQGGEPTLHKDFYKIVNNVDKPMDLMTNLNFDIEDFMRNVNYKIFKRNAPYASIRVSYHPGQQDLHSLMRRVRRLLDNGYQVGVWMVDHPEYKGIINIAQEFADIYKIDFRLKEFLGTYKGETYGTYKFPGCIDKKFKREVLCKTTELLISPNGLIHRCHADLYAGRYPMGKVTDDNPIHDDYFHCEEFGYCNPCDVKVKTNRFQEHGHTSVDILFE